MKVNVDNWRWAGVPFYIRTGKKLGLRASEIVITFKNRPHDIFSERGENANDEFPNRLVIRVQPHEGLRLHLTSKKPGPGKQMCWKGVSCLPISPFGLPIRAFFFHFR